MKHLDIPQYKQDTTPSNPPVGYDSLYFKSDDNLYKLDSNGVEELIAATGDFIPYIGASSNVNLGTHKLIADTIEDTTGAARLLVTPGPFWSTNGVFLATRFISSVAIGTAPFSVTSTTVSTNLNADLLDGQHGTYYATASGYVPYTGATTDLSLGTNQLRFGATEETRIYYDGTNTVINPSFAGSGKLDIKDSTIIEGNLEVTAGNEKIMIGGTGNLVLQYDTPGTKSKIYTVLFPLEITSASDITIIPTSNLYLGNLTSNGFVKTSGGTGQLGIDTNTYITEIQFNNSNNVLANQVFN